MAEIAKYEAYRVAQPIVTNKTGSLFGPKHEIEESRKESIRMALEFGRQSKESWTAGQSEEIDGGMWFKVGYREAFQNYTQEQGEFRPMADHVLKVTDVFLDYATGIMLIRKDRSAPSPFLVSRALWKWLKDANHARETNFDVFVQSIPVVEDFLVELRRAKLISRLSFVVHGPNPDDEPDVVDSLARFTQEHGIQSTTVTLNSPSIDKATAEKLSTAAGKLGNSVSATIEDNDGVAPRTIRMKKKARLVNGPKRPSAGEGRHLLDRLRHTLGAGSTTEESRDEQTRN